MKKVSTLFLKIVLVLMGLAVLTAMLCEPHLEGRNVNADWVTIYFHDPFLTYIYLGSVPFFFALCQAFKLLGYIEQNKTFSQASVTTLRKIKYSAITIIVFLVGAMSWIRIFAGQDDPAGAIAIGLVLTFTTLVISIFAAVLQKLFQNALDIKSENDLVV